MLLLGLAVAALITIIVHRFTAPPMMTFDAISTQTKPASAASPFIVKARTPRRDAEGCTNGIQIEVKDARGELTKLQIPPRTIDGDLSTYSLIIPESLQSGRYALKLRESFYCGGAPEIVEAPWVFIEVKQ